MEKFLSMLTEIVKTLNGIPWVSTLMSMIWFLLIAIAAGGMICAIKGKKSPFNRGISAMFCLSIIYMAAILLGVYIPSFREGLSNHLPFLSINDEGIRLQSAFSMSLSELFPELLKLLLLSFWINCTESFIPTGSNPFNWLGWRLLSWGIALVCYCCVNLLGSWLGPKFPINWALIIVLGIFFITVLIVILRFVFKKVLHTDNAKFNALYNFFALNSFGNQFAKMVETTLLSLCTLAWFSHKGYAEILFSKFGDLVYWPVLLLFGSTLYIFTMVYNEKTG